MSPCCAPSISDAPIPIYHFVFFPLRSPRWVECPSCLETRACVRVPAGLKARRAWTFCLVLGSVIHSPIHIPLRICHGRLFKSHTHSASSPRFVPLAASLSASLSRSLSPSVDFPISPSLTVPSRRIHPLMHRNQKSPVLSRICASYIHNSPPARSLGRASRESRVSGIPIPYT